MNKQGTNRIYRRPVSLTLKKKKKKDNNDANLESQVKEVSK